MTFSKLKWVALIAGAIILAAIVAPAYRYYMIENRLERVQSILNGLADQSIAYYKQHKVFANAEQIGLTTVDDPTLGDASLLSPYLKEVLLSSNAHSRCPTGVLHTSLNLRKLGEEDITSIVINYYMFDFDNRIHKFCFYTYTYDQEQNGVERIVPNCVNAVADDNAMEQIQAIMNKCL